MKTKVLIIILIIVINIIFFNINVVQAAGISDVITGGDSFLEAGKGEDTTIDETKLQDVSTMIYNILLTLGIAIAVVIASILGIKFMIGSVEEKAQIKDSLVPFVIGCVVVFGAFGFWKIFVTIGNDVSDKTKTELAANYVISDDGKTAFEIGKLYCKTCNEKVTSKTISQGFCNKCHTTFKTTCTACGKTLTYDEFLEGRCSRCMTAIKDNLFVSYEK